MLLFYTIQRLLTVSQAYKFKILQLYNINYHKNFYDYRTRHHIFISTSEISKMTVVIYNCKGSFSPAAKCSSLITRVLSKIIKANMNVNFSIYMNNIFPYVPTHPKKYLPLNL